MSKWIRRFGKILTAAGISAFITFSSLAVPIEASAARAVTDDIMIRNDASRDAGAIGSLQEGEEVTILDAVQSADGYVWYYIQLENGNTGYVRSDLIEASDEELAAINAGQPEEDQTQAPETEEEPEEKPEEEPEQEPEEKPAEQEPQTQEAGTAATGTAPAQTPDGEYDATKDPSANFRVSYDTDENGNGEWYVHNDDNGSKWKVSDLQGQGGAAAKSEGVSGIWRTLAILFGIIAIALAAFVLFLLKSIRDGRSKTTRGRALEAAAAGYDEEDDDESYFDDDDEEDVEEDDDPDDIGSESEEANEEEDHNEQADQSEKKSDEKPANTPDSTITMDVASEPEITEIPTDEIESAIAAATAQIEKNISEEEKNAGPASAPITAEKTDDRAPASEPAAIAEEQDDDEADNPADEDSDEDYSDEDEDYEEEDEDYSDEDEEYEDEDYEDEDYEEEEEDEAPRRSRTSSKGGFFGFLKKMFGSDSQEDSEDDGEDFDDYEDEPEEHEFDEFKEYPEDIDLLPKADSSAF